MKEIVLAGGCFWGVEAYWVIIDPTMENRQGPDIGTQYRTGIYYFDEEDRDVILQSKNEEQKNMRMKLLLK